MMKIKPCMPEWVDLIDELVKLEEEHSEMIDAIIEGDYEEVCREAIDVMQVNANIATFCRGGAASTREYNHAVKMLELALSKIGRSNKKYKRELLERFIDEHYQKMERRKKEWAGGERS